MKKVVLIGIDGASWQVIDYLLKAGKLPLFKELISNGVREKLYDINMVEPDYWQLFHSYREYKKGVPRCGVHPDAADWISLATGAMPDKHGVVSPIERDSAGIAIGVSRRIRIKPNIWELLARHGKTVGIIGWMSDWPPFASSQYAIARVSDILYKGKFTYDLSKESFICNPTYPRGLWATLREIKPDEEIKDFIQKFNFSIRKQLVSSLVYDSLYLQWTKYLLKNFPQPDFLTLCLYGIHNLSHVFFYCLDTERRHFNGIIHRRRQKKYGGVIEGYYQYLEKKIEEITKLTRASSIIILVSSYGMSRSRVTKKYLLMDKIYEKLGFLEYNGNRVDYNSTRVYDDQNQWGIFAVRKGFIRSKNARKLFSRLRNNMLNIRTERGESVFNEITFNSSDNSFQVIPNYKAIRYSTKLRIKDEVISANKLVDFVPHYALHGPEGIFIASSSKDNNIGIRRPFITTLDIAPTILSIFGLKNLDKDLTGENILFVKKGEPG